MTTKKPTSKRMDLKKVDKKRSPSAVETENEYLKVALAEKDAQIEVLTAECDILRRQLAKISSLGDRQKEEVVNNLLKKYPNCFEKLEFDNTWDEATEK